MLKRFRAWLKTLRVDKFKWNPSSEWNAQWAHVLLGALAAALPFALWHVWWAAAIGSAAVSAYMYVKEFSFDIFIERESVETGWKDIAYETAGNSIVWILLWWKGVL